MARIYPTHRELLNKLPSPLKEQAIANMKANYGSLYEYSLNYPVENSVEMLALSFSYKETPEGEIHWKSVENALSLLESDNPIKKQMGERLFNCLESWISDKYLQLPA